MRYAAIVWLPITEHRRSLLLNSNKVVVCLKAWPILRQHWVIERFDLERAIEALHRGIVVAVSRLREPLCQAHAVGRIPECLSSVDTAAVTVEHRSRSQASA